MAADTQFDAATHTYRINGRTVPSVTQIIGELFPDQYGPMSDSDREYVMQRGTAVHHGCKLFDDGQLDWDSVVPEIRQRIEAWARFRKECPDFQVAVSEQFYGCESYQYAGTVDRVFIGPQGHTLCDIKSTTVATARIQLGGYSRLLQDAGCKCFNAVIVQVNDDGTYKTGWLNRAELNRMENLFLACLSVYGFKARNNLLKGKS